MINVIASIKVKPGKKAEFIEIFKSNVPKVLQEKGCIDYTPTVDVNSSIPIQVLEENTVTILEKWESLECLRNHLETPHMIAYGERVKDIVESVSAKVLETV